MPHPVADASVAGWIEAGVGEFGALHALLPEGFAAYARILHPVEVAEGRTVRWRELAGGPLRPTVCYDEIAGSGEDEPWQGSLIPEALSVLVEVLERHTRTPELCYFGLWDGWGWIDVDGPRAHLPARDHLLFEGPIDAAT